MGYISLAVAVVVFVAVGSSRVELSRKTAFRCLGKLVTAWSSCDQKCGTDGLQTRIVNFPAYMQCIGLPANHSCPTSSTQTKPCNRRCYNDGQIGANGCICKDKFWGKCCENWYPRKTNVIGVSDVIRVNDTITARCVVNFVRPIPSIYWRVLPDGELVEGEYIHRRCNAVEGCVTLISQYKTHIEESDDDAVLQCVVSQKDNSSVVWARQNSQSTRVLSDDMLPIVEVYTSFPWRYLSRNFNIHLVTLVANMLDIPTAFVKTRVMLVNSKPVMMKVMLKKFELRSDEQAVFVQKLTKFLHEKYRFYKDAITVSVEDLHFGSLIPVTSASQ